MTKPSKRFLAGLTGALVLASLIPATSVGAAGNNQCWDYKPSERSFKRRMNAERIDSKVGRMRLDPELSKAARLHTHEMVNNDNLYHTPSDKLRKRVTNWTVLGENVGVGGTVSSLHDAFMDSPAHRDNILYNPFNHVGVGVVKRDGRMWVTVIFQSVENPGTPLKMPRC